MSPEVLKGEDYNFSADWWSCGVLLYELLAGKVQYMYWNMYEPWVSLLCQYNDPLLPIWQGFVYTFPNFIVFKISFLKPF